LQLGVLDISSNLMVEMMLTNRLVVALLLLGSLSLPAVHGGQLELTNSWSVVIGAHSDSSPAIGPDGSIYFGSWDHKLWALKPDGSRKWVFAAESEIKSSPALGRDGTLYFGCRDHKFYAVGSNGLKQWAFKTGAWVDSSPALAGDGTIYFGSWDKIFYALNPDGTKKWQFQTEGEIICSPAVGLDGTIYFGSHDKKFYALGADGRKRWEFATGGPIISSPAINRDQVIYFTSVDGFFYALNLDGTLRWRLRTGGITESSPVIGVEGILFVGVNSSLWAISPEGKELWPRWVEEPIEASPLPLADGSVCCIARAGLLINVDKAIDLKWTYYCWGYGFATPAVGPAGTIYLPERSSRFCAVPNKIPLARSPWPRFRGNARNTGNANDGEDKAPAPVSAGP
jgi:outer membrane protein assembly factor BamB